MSVKVDWEIQNAGALLETINENQAALDQKNYPIARKQDLVTKHEEAKKKNAAQIKASKFVNENTLKQNQALAASLQLCVKIQNAAKVAYVDDPAHLKRYRIGEKQPTTVGKQLNWCEYFSAILLEDDDVLLTCGLVQQDITDFNTAYNTLASIDSIQEKAKKLQSSATMTRDAAIDELKVEVKKTYNFAKSAFAGNKEMLNKFKPIPKGRGGSNGGSDDGETPSPDNPVPNA